MSELMNARSNRGHFRWQLLSTVSAVALLAAICAANESQAADQDTDHPTVWIDLGGDLEHVGGQGDSFPVGFLAANPNSPVLHPVSPLQAQSPPPFEFAEEGKISFQPENLDWVFSVAVNYGRSSNFKHVDHQTNKIRYQTYRNGVPVDVGPTNTGTRARGTDDFADTQVHHRESHTILDFSVGKDVGLGLFGRDASSILSLGMRFAQFASKTTVDIRARPDIQEKYGTFGATKIVLPHFNTYHGTGQASRSFHGIGPSLSWNGSAPFAGNLHDGEVIFDWGAGVALLFGRQRASVRHQESGHYHSFAALGTNPSTRYTLVYQHSGGHNTDRSVVVPNVGGFAGASYRIENFKVSLGYRADFFFGAMDGGIDTPKSETLGFYGPFATISIGIGG